HQDVPILLEGNCRRLVLVVELGRDGPAGTEVRVQAAVRIVSGDGEGLDVVREVEERSGDHNRAVGLDGDAAGNDGIAREVGGHRASGAKGGVEAAVRLVASE